MTKNEATLETVNTIISELEALNLVNEYGNGYGIKGLHCARALNGLKKMAEEIEREISIGKEW